LTGLKLFLSADQQYQSIESNNDKQLAK